MPALIAGKDTSPDHHARVITTSSSAAMMYTINWDSFKDGPARRKMSPSQLYSQSKFVRIHLVSWYRMGRTDVKDVMQANVVIARQIAKRYADQGIISISLDPGMHFDLQCNRIRANS